MQLGRTALIMAAINGHTQIVAELILRGANVEATDRVSCFVITGEYEVLLW